MALTLPTENRLKDAGLITFFDRHRIVWTSTAQRTYDFVRQGFPSGTTVRHDDVAKELAPFVEVNEDLRTYRKTEGLKQQLWVGLFADLVLDRTWATISAVPTPPPLPGTTP